MSIHADDEFSLKLALESELDDVAPGHGLAAVVIERYRKVRRRRIAGAVGLVVAFTGIGVPLGLTSAGGGASARSSPIVLRLASYRLKLPSQYHVASAKTGPCAAVAHAVTPHPGARPVASAAGPEEAMAAIVSGECVVMLLMPPLTSGDTRLPSGAREVTAGRYHAWIMPGYPQAGHVAGLVIEGVPSGGRIQELVIGASGLSQAALVALVATGLQT